MVNVFFSCFQLLVSQPWAQLVQGAYNSGKPGKPGKIGNFLIRENSGNFEFTQGILVSVIVGIEFCA